MSSLLQLAEAAPPWLAPAAFIVAVAILVARVVLRMARKGPPSGKPAKRSTPPPPRTESELAPIVSKLVDALTNDKGEPVSSCQSIQVVECTERFDSIEGHLDQHGRMHRKQFSALHKVDVGLRDVMEFLTNGTDPPERPPVSADIEDEDTSDTL